jgi:carboxypeptidase PM20D1
MSSHFSHVIDKLSEAVSYRTVSDVERDRINTGEFREFLDFLHRAYPAVFRSAEAEVVDQYGLLLHIPPAEDAREDGSVLPVLLLAHYDVVPADGEGWRHPPFSGEIIEDAVWGRGTLDNKGSLITLLEAVERQLQQGWIPRRGIYIFAGHDEEIGGGYGAKQAAALLAERGLRFSFVLDEGMTLVTPDIFPMSSRNLALIGIGEKGHIDLRLTAKDTSGHSSTPPRRTSAGNIARAVARIERRQFPPRLTPPVEQLLKGISPHVKGAKRLLLAHPRLARPLLLRVLSNSPRSNALIRTTRAVTMLSGSTKENVLPERSQAVVNCRILPGETMNDVLNRIDKAGRRYGVTVERIPELQANDPLPVADTAAPGYLLIARAVNSVYPDAAVVPSLVLGTTDSRHFSSLTDNIYRFVPFLLNSDLLATVHGTDERVPVETILKAVSSYEAVFQQL